AEPRGPQRRAEGVAGALATPNSSAEVGLERPKVDDRARRSTQTRRHQSQIERTVVMSKAANPKTPKIFRVTLEVADLDQAAKFYGKLLGTEGKRHPGAPHYFDCGGVILAVLGPTAGGMTPTPGPKTPYFSVTDL